MAKVREDTNFFPQGTFILYLLRVIFHSFCRIHFCQEKGKRKKTSSDSLKAFVCHKETTLERAAF